MDNIGTIIQGQTVNFIVTLPSTATQEEINMVKDNDVYLGIYGTWSTPPQSKRIMSTKDGTMTKTVDANGKVSISCLLAAKVTKEMYGRYVLEMLIKNSDNTFTSPCENAISFDVVKRKISEIIK